MHFSKSTQCFYPDDLTYAALPADISPCSQSDYALAQTRSSGETLDYVNGSVIIIPAPALTVAQARIDQSALLTKSYTAAIQVPVPYMATTFQADIASQDILAKSLVAGAVSSGFAWYDINNAPVPMTFVQAQGLAGVMLAQRQIAFVHLRTQKNAVMAATTIPQIQAIL